MLSALRVGLSVLLVVCLPQSVATSDDYGCKANIEDVKCRWLYPCKILGQVLDWDTETEPDLHPDDRLKNLASDCEFLKNNMEKWLSDYVKKRFGSEEEAKKVEENYQEMVAFKPKLISNSQTDLTLSQTSVLIYEDLSKFSIILDTMLIEEENELEIDVSFDKKFLFTKESVIVTLCKLKIQILYIKASLPSDVRDEIRGVQLPSAPTKAIRHSRDYINLRNLVKTLEAAKSAFSSFRKPKDTD